MNKLVFLYNDLLDKEIRERLNIPLEFLCFGYIEGRLYHFKENFIGINNTDIKRTWREGVIYGGIFILDKPYFYERILDASLVCSKSALYQNHKLDIMHRHSVKCTPIHFNTVEDFAYMRYTETEDIEVDTYLGNPQNEYVKHRILSPHIRNRELSGLDVYNFVKCCKQQNKF